jgi:hypothetical protein
VGVIGKPFPPRYARKCAVVRYDRRMSLIANTA